MDAVLSSKSRKVLVVEDDAAMRTMFRAALQLEGFAVVAVEDGLDALRHLDADIPAAVVLDLGLPRLDGRDVHREICTRDDLRGLPIVIVTGGPVDDLDPDEFACILRKPLDPDSLVTAVQNCLRKIPQ
jgi:DNA-binding response OmpR family regulator